MSDLQWHRVNGRSMWPLAPPIEVGVRHCRPDQLRRGDIVAFLSHDRAIWLHRIVQVTADGFITRGDTNGYDDPPVPFTALLGRLEALRLHTLTLPLPPDAPLATVLRHVGLGWARLAPGLRQLLRQAKRSVDP